MLATIHDKFLGLSRVAVWIGGGALMLSAIMVTLDVLARKIFSVTISGSDEISGYVFAAGTTWAYSYCLLTRSNIRIDAFYNLLGRRTKALLDIGGLLLLLYYIYLLTANAWGMFAENIKFNSTAQTTLATPLWIPQVFWISGLGFFLLCLIFLAIYCFTALVRGDWATIDRIAGVKSVEEEIDEETHV
ncbi:MAG: TRAP transporter small permease [Alphaproteobacteria bacterium]|jgi:TRAP-type C4-dicarboxylate transport system permease small subunit|nr:TRAP transporter small permease [Alphaproteobacteria bacterium]|tara:strand:+ start:440 stop:1006 length:567 start_codon:yes stop_codon:yes gene_type:complete